MNWVDRYFFLKTLSPFHRLPEGELAHLAHQFTWREWAPQTVVRHKGEILLHLHVIASGSLIEEGGSALPVIFGPSSLIEGRELPNNIRTGDDPVQVLLMSKRNVLTMTAQLPELFLDYLQECDPEDLRL